MTPFQNRLCPITQRLAEDMLIRNLAQATIDAYTLHAKRFADFIKKPLDRATCEDVRSFQLYLIRERKLAYASFNQAVCALRFLYTHTVQVPWPVTMVPYGKRHKTLPTVLSRHEVNRLIECTPDLKHRTFLTTLYASGMRFSEAAHLTLQDIDSHRMMLRIACGKGRKERHVPLSPRLLEMLREYWKEYRPTHYLFPGKTPQTPYADTTIGKVIKVSALKAGIRKRVYPHVLRHSYATGLLEAGVDLLTISKLLGHASFITTMVYLHCRQEHLAAAPSPLDWLPVKQLPTYQPPVESQHANLPKTSQQTMNNSPERPLETSAETFPPAAAILASPTTTPTSTSEPTSAGETKPIAPAQKPKRKYTRRKKD